MNAQDLRIGNYISYGGVICTVVDVLCDSVNTKLNEGILYSDIEPILLTKELLFKVGFEIDGVFCDYILRLCDEKMLGYSLEYNMVYLAQHYKGQHFRDVNLGEFKYLHDLQNLYYILTETELKIQHND
jgi:hypothetical protein